MLSSILKFDSKVLNGSAADHWQVGRLAEAFVLIRKKVHPKIHLKFTRSSCEIYWKFTGNPFEILPKSFEIRSSKTKD